MNTITEINQTIIWGVFIISMLILLTLILKYCHQQILDSRKVKESRKVLKLQNEAKEIERTKKRKDRIYESAWKCIEMFEKKEQLTPEELRCKNAALKLIENFMSGKENSIGE